MISNLKKIIRFICIYGFSRTLTKALGRLRPRFKLWLILKFPLYSMQGKCVGLIGCGHHAFSSISYFLTTSTNCHIAFVSDINLEASETLAYAYNSVNIGSSFKSGKFNGDLPDVVYISSSHSSHTDYAIEFLNYGCDVYIEKPIAINVDQLNRLTSVVSNSKNKVYVGYNRPHSPAIMILKDRIKDFNLPFTLSCFITGHLIAKDHWYRNPNEGTRVVANLGHWIDLVVHILFWAKKLPEFLDILISYSDLNTPSDNIVVSLVSPRHDLINIAFTSRSEPFEGVNETINFQQGDLIAKIDDFRKTKIWQGDSSKVFRHWPKNNGHKEAVLQPFRCETVRQWIEIEQSTRLMLHIEEMVKLQINQSKFEF